MCHIFPCVTEKPAFPTRDAPIDKRNVFLLSRRAVNHCRHKSLHEKQVPTVFQIGSKFPNSNYLRKQTFKSWIVQIKRCTENHGVLLSLYILELSIFSCQPFCNSCSFSLFHFFALNYIFLLQISSSITLHRGHPHSTYAQRGRGQVKPNAYDCVQGGEGVQGCVRTQNNFFWTTKSQIFSFLVQKKLLHCHLLLYIEKCKPALSPKQKPQKSF